MKRRNFLKQSALASTSVFVPSFLKAFGGEQIMGSRSGKILVVIQLSGGNDGLNTIVPFQNDIYYKNRPKLAIQKNKVLRLTDDLGFNPALKSLRNLYDDGMMSIINSVGYPNPDRSHFRSMDIWHTASDSHEYLSSGWLGRYLDSDCQDGQRPYHALELDDSLSLAMRGKERKGFAANNPQQLLKTTNNSFLKSVAQQGHHDEEQVAYLYKTMIDTQNSASYLAKKAKTYKSNISYPNNGFAKDLKQIAALITADSDTKIYYVSLGGFDTHAYQKSKQGRLLTNYAEGVAAFVKDLKQNGLLDDTLIMTFSEFGRRVKQNASGGTDHGTANNMFLMGGRLKKQGFYNAAPQLTDLDKGDLKYEIDFRSVYSSILDDWLEADADQILGGRFDKLRVL